MHHLSKNATLSFHLLNKLRKQSHQFSFSCTFLLSISKAVLDGRTNIITDYVDSAIIIVCDPLGQPQYNDISNIRFNKKSIELHNSQTALHQKRS